MSMFLVELREGGVVPAQILPVSGMERRDLVLGWNACGCPILWSVPKLMTQGINAALGRLPEDLVAICILAEMIDSAVGVLARTAKIGFDGGGVQLLGLHDIDKVLAWL